MSAATRKTECFASFSVLLLILPVLSFSFLCIHAQSALYVYVNSLLLGFGTSTCMVCSVQLEADLVGENSKSGAFVYGALSFADKLANGIVIFLLQVFYSSACVFLIPSVLTQSSLADLQG